MDSPTVEYPQFNAFPPAQYCSPHSTIPGTDGRSSPVPVGHVEMGAVNQSQEFLYFSMFPQVFTNLEYECSKIGEIVSNSFG